MAEANVTSHPAGTNGADPGYGLFFGSFISLFFELALIRWLPAQLLFLGFFSNLVFIATIFGLGIGFFAPAYGRKGLFSFLALSAVLVPVFALLGFPAADINISQGPIYYFNAANAFTAKLPVPFLATLIILALVGWAMPLGAYIARRFGELPALRAYSINVAGSLSGTVAFALLAWLQTPPAVWFGLVLSLCVVLIAADAPGDGRRIPRWVVALVLALIALAPTIPELGDERVHWSSYSKITVWPHQTPAGAEYADTHFLQVNNIFFMETEFADPLPQFDGSGEAVAGPQMVRYLEQLAETARRRAAANKPLRVAMLGVGTGRLVSMIRAVVGPEAHIDAVELDPQIVALSGIYNRRRPFNDAAVNVVIDDARAFLHDGDTTYDVITMFGVDAVLLPSPQSTVRFDSYLYTTEAFAQIRRRLAPAGLFIVSYGVPRPFIRARLYETIREVFGWPPAVAAFAHNTIAFLTANDRPLEQLDDVPAWNNVGDVAPASDDWPFFFLKTRTLPVEYLTVLIFFFVAALALAVVLRQRGQGGGYLLFFFFLGAGFMLVEASTVSRLHVLFSVNWYVASIVFSLVMVAILLGNLIASRVPRRLLPIVLAATAAAVGVSLVFEPAQLLGAGLPAQIGGAIAFAGPAFLLAAIGFATALRDLQPSRVTNAMGANLVGMVFGGVLEFSAMITGYRFLLVHGLFFYFAALGIWWLLGARLFANNSAE